ncbi:MAG: DUF4105 domain-containing protein [Gemmatimonadaceae bacterium]
MQPAGNGSELTVHLLTMGPGDLVWEKFGHNAIWIHDAAANTDVVYHWGLFDFADADFMPNFLKGNMRYSMGAFDLAGTIDAYRQVNRTVWAQQLNIEPAGRKQLNEFLTWNNLPENRKYSYDYYRDNCSTRVRDALDRAFGGAIRSASANRPSGTSYRFHTQRLTQDDPLVYTGTLAALGHPVDDPISNWEEMFLPVKLMQHLRTMRVDGPAGRSVPLVADERVVFQATRAPEAVAVTRGIGGYLLVGALAMLIGGAMWMFSRGARRSPLPPLGFAAIWSFVAGILGTVLGGLWLATNHVYSYRNENLLQATPLSLVLMAMLVHLMWRLRRARPASRSSTRLRAAAQVAVVIAALSLAGFVMQIFPAFRQGNGGIIALAMPLHVGVALLLVSLSRQVRRTSGKP